MTVEKNIPNCNIEEVSQLEIGEGFIRLDDDGNENFFIITGKNPHENFSRCVNLKDGLEYLIQLGSIVRKIDKLIIE